VNGQSLKISAVKMIQPMGEFFVGVINYDDLCQISFVDMRRIENTLDKYIGIQRKLNENRVAEIGKFVNTIDAAFPTSVVLAVQEECAVYEEDALTLTLSEYQDEDNDDRSVKFNDIAKVLDGQHRIEGLRAFDGEAFQVPVTIFVNADIADQAYIFATVNLAQTKVNRSLVYDLLDYSKSRSPQRTCHDIAVALNKTESSPFFKMIKRLGSATPGVSGETITQAAFVNSLLPMLSLDPVSDRDILLRGKKLEMPSPDELEKQPFRLLFIEEQDSQIARNVSEYFHAVASLWPDDWKSRDKGNMLPRTNGFRAFMRFLKDAYLYLRENSGERQFDRDQYQEILQKVDIEPGAFSTETFPPGTSGETLLLDRIRSNTNIGVD
jgi:DGQHR domain-containing protein